MSARYRYDNLLSGDLGQGIDSDFCGEAVAGEMIKIRCLKHRSLCTEKGLGCFTWMVSLSPGHYRQ